MDINGVMDKKRFDQNDLKKQFFKVISKLHNFPRNVDIFGKKNKKQLFESNIKKKLIFLEIFIFTDIGKKRFLKVISKNVLFSKY